MTSSSWRTARLGDLAHVRKGVSYQGALLDRPGPRLLGLGTVTPGGGLKLADARTYAGPIKDSQRIRPGEMLIALTDITQDGRILGSPAVLPSTAQGDFAVTHHVGRVEISEPERLDTLFLYYLLQSHEAREYMRGVASGTTVRAVSVGDAEDFSAVFPPIAEQRAIAHVLGALDGKIELNRRLSETLEQVGRHVYRSWRDAQSENEFEPIGAVCRVMSGGTPPKLMEEFWSGPIPWISPKAMTGIHCDEPDAFVSQAAIGNGTRLAPAGSTLVMVRGMGLHERVRVSQARGDVTFNQDVKALYAADLEPTLLLFAVLDAQEALLTRVESSGHGTGVLPTGALTGCQIAVPDRSSRRSIAERLNLVNDRIALSRAQARTLADLRDVLLPRLLDGRLAC